MPLDGTAIQSIGRTESGEPPGELSQGPVTTKLEPPVEGDSGTHTDVGFGCALH